MIQNQTKTGLLRFFKRKQNKQFVSELDYIMNRGRQSHKAIETLVKLRELDIEEEDELKINFHFQTNSIEKTEKLINVIEKKLNYDVHKWGNSSENNLFVVTGETTAIKMVHKDVKKWALEMCELGYNHDSRFNNWEVNLYSK